MLDLYNNKYDRETLKQYIYAVKLIDIIKTQTIDVKFAVRYILNEKYDVGNDLSIVSDEINDNDIYNFDDVMDYYDNRKEFKFPR